MLVAEAAREPIAEAMQIQLEAAALGFDWNHVDELWAKLQEEIGELREAAHQGEARTRDELGDLLFMVLNLARHLRVDPVQALSQANAKFSRRFAHVLSHRAEWDAVAAPTRLDAMERLWVEAKRLGL